MSTQWQLPNDAFLRTNSHRYAMCDCIIWEDIYHDLRREFISFSNKILKCQYIILGSNFIVNEFSFVDKFTQLLQLMQIFIHRNTLTQYDQSQISSVNRWDPWSTQCWEWFKQVLNTVLTRLHWGSFCVQRQTNTHSPLPPRVFKDIVTP